MLLAGVRRQTDARPLNGSTGTDIYTSIPASGTKNQNRVVVFVIGSAITGFSI